MFIGFLVKRFFLAVNPVMHHGRYANSPTDGASSCRLTQQIIDDFGLLIKSYKMAAQRA